MKEWICEEVPALSIEGKVISTMLHHEQELVRCKDCAYALSKEGVQHGHIVCTKPFTEHWQVIKPNNWFCADGKPKEEAKAEPVKTAVPDMNNVGGIYWYQCSECGQMLAVKQSECPNCHSKVNWEGWY